MFKKTAVALTLSALSVSASANWVAGAGYTNLSLDGDATLGALVASVGYKFPINESISLVPEARVGFGIKDDSGLELDNMYGIGVRGEYALESGLYLFVAPTLTKFKTSYEVDGFDFESEFGGGANTGGQSGPDDNSVYLGDDLGWFDLDDWDDSDSSSYQSYSDWLADQGGTANFSGNIDVDEFQSGSSPGFISGGSGSATSDWEFGFGIGAGFRINDFVAAELSYEMIDEADLLTLQARFSF